VPHNFIGKPKLYVVGEWYYSEACLEDLIEVQLCMKQSKSKLQCIGMLLRYSDGHLRSLGQWRFDSAHVAIKPAGCLYICTQLAGNKSYVHYVGLEKSEISGPEEVWHKISVHDTLSWWFNAEQTEIFVKRQLAA